MLTLVGILVVVVGFALRLNPLLVVTVAGLATGLASGLGPVDVVSAFGKAFIESRYVAIVWLVLPVIGLLERAGLKERARAVIARHPRRDDGPRADDLLRHPPGHRRARPHLARRPRADGAPARRADGRRRGGEPVRRAAGRARATASARTPRRWTTSRVFFGEDIFIAIGSILLIKGFLEQNGIHVEPTQLALWAMPTAVWALLIHGARLVLLDRSLKRELAKRAAPNADAHAPRTPRDPARARLRR